VIALRLAKEGCDLCLTARSAEALAEVAAECEKEGVKVVYIVADAKNTAELTAAVDKCVAELGGLSIVINNGHFPFFFSSSSFFMPHSLLFIKMQYFLAGKLVMTRNDFSEWEDCIRTNLIPTMAVSKHAIQYLKANESSASMFFHILESPRKKSKILSLFSNPNLIVRRMYTFQRICSVYVFLYHNLMFTH
jgi:NAD(P)-dependent dehydrogenase (short-subunit alcohol dehydrogenase family)